MADNRRQLTLTLAKLGQEGTMMRGLEVMQAYCAVGHEAR